MPIRFYFVMIRSIKHRTFKKTGYGYVSYPFIMVQSRILLRNLENMERVGSRIRIGIPTGYKSAKQTRVQHMSAAVSFRFLKLPAKHNCCYSLLSEAVQLRITKARTISRLTRTISRVTRTEAGSHGL